MFITSYGNKHLVSGDDKNVWNGTIYEYHILVHISISLFKDRNLHKQQTNALLFANQGTYQMYETAPSMI
jgi:hypothetical protein